MSPVNYPTDPSLKTHRHIFPRLSDQNLPKKVHHDKRQWAKNLFTSQMVINKITPSVKKNFLLNSLNFAYLNLPIKN